MLSIQKIFGHEGGRRERTSDDCVTGTARATRITAKSGTTFSTGALTAGVTDPGYSLSRPSITLSMPLTTSVNRS